MFILMSTYNALVEENKALKKRAADLVAENHELHILKTMYPAQLSEADVARIQKDEQHQEIIAELKQLGIKVNRIDCKVRGAAKGKK
jgi:uncharacterized protein YqeY